MDISNIKYKANYYALLILAFVIPLERKLIAPAIILFFLTSIINLSTNLIAKKNVLWFGLLYVIYAISVAYASNTEIGLSDLMTKLSLLIFPVSIFFSNLDFRQVSHPFFKSFIDGCFAVIVISIIRSILLFYFSLNPSIFFYGEISVYLHPSYLAMLLCMCNAIIYYYLFFPSSSFNYSKKLSFFLLVLFSVFVLILASKTGLICMLIIHFFAIGKWIIKNKAFVKGGIVVMLILASLVGIYKFSKVFNERMNELMTLSETDNISNGSTVARKEIWITALDLITKKPLLGYGNGDVKEVLVKEYEKKELKEIAKHQLNAHNQFLQTTLSLGILGGLLLVFMIVVPFYYSIKNKDYLYLTFLLLIIINFFTESMLERQVGVVFYALFNSLFFVKILSLNKQKVVSE